MMKQLRSLFGGKAAPPADPKDLFAAEVEQFLRSLPGVQNVTRASGDFAFEVVTSSGSRRIFLDNAFAESREMSPEERRDKIAFFFTPVVMNESSEPWDAARESFVPVLRGATYGMELWLANPAAAVVRRPFLPHVDLLIAMDGATSMSYVCQSTVDRWKVGEPEVFEAALARVALLAHPSVELYDETHGPLWIVTSNDSYETSRLVVPGWLASFRGRVDGDPIAIIPERGTLMVGGDGRPEMIERLLDKAERECAASNRRISPALYTVGADDGVVPYARPGGDPLAAKVMIAHEKLALYEYGAQREALNELHEKNGLDVFVASYQVFQASDGANPYSRCLWAKGVRSYLPRADRVMLLLPGKEKGAKPKLVVEVPFESIESRLTRVPGLHPARFETSGEFPSERELRLMGARPGAE